MLGFIFTLTPQLRGKAHKHTHVHTHTTKGKHLHKWQVANIWPLDFLNGSNCVLEQSDWQGLSGRNECSGKGRLARYDSQVAAVWMRRAWLDNLVPAFLIPLLFLMWGRDTLRDFDSFMQSTSCVCVSHMCVGSRRMPWVSVSEGSLPLDAHSSG